MKKHKIINIIVIFIVIIQIAIIIFLAMNQTPKTQNGIIVNDDSKLQVVSSAKLKTWTTEGAILTLDEESAFGKLEVFVPNKYLNNSYIGGDYLNIYYNGVIQDGTPAQFEEIYSVEPFSLSSLSMYNEWTTFPDMDENGELFKTITKTITDNSTEAKDNLTFKSILAVSKSYTPIYAVLYNVKNDMNENALVVYYVSIGKEGNFVILQESLLTGTDRLANELERMLSDIKMG